MSDVLNWLATHPLYLLGVAAAILGLLVGVRIASLSSVKRDTSSDPQSLGRIKNKIDNYKNLMRNGYLVSAVTQKQNAWFSGFALLSATFVYFKELRATENLTAFGVNIGDAATLLGIGFGAVAFVLLVNIWRWALGLEHAQRHVTALEQEHKALKTELSRKGQTDLQGFFDVLNESDGNETAPATVASEHPDLPPLFDEPLEKSIVPKERAEAESPDAGNPFAGFLKDRIALPFRLSAHLTSKREPRAWSVGKISSVRELDGHIQGIGAEADAAEEFYFRRTSFCTEPEPKVGDTVFFVPVERKKASQHRHAFLICVLGAPAKAILREKFRGTAYFVDILDGSNNIASIPGYAPKSATGLKLGDNVEGTVSFNLRGVVLQNLTST